MLTSPARLCRPCCLAGPAHAAATAGLAIQEGEIRRETDCLLEGAGFEPPVPREKVRQRVPRERLKDEFEVRSTRCWREMDSNHLSRQGETLLARAMWFLRTGPPARGVTGLESDQKFA